MNSKALLLFAGLFASTALPSLAQQSVYGCPVQPTGSVFYSRIDSLPLLPQSATYSSNMGSATLSWDTAMGVTVANSSAPTINAQFAYTPGYNGVWRYPAFYAVDRQGGSLGGNVGTDHHSIVVDSDTCTVWETYHAYVNTVDGSIQTGHTCNGNPCNAQSGWKYTGTSYALPTQGTTDAAGLPFLPLLWRGHEILDGNLKHPLRFTMARGYIQAGHPQWPASGTNGWGGTNTPPYGTRFRLKSTAAISLSGLSAQQQIYANTIINALRQYGMVLADIGTNFNASVDDEAAQDPNVMAALGKVGSQVRPSLLEAVDLTSLKPAIPSYATANGSSTVPPVLVGARGFLNIQAGASSQLASWVNGPVTLKNVTWEVAAGDIGTISSTGLYTPPASVTGIVQGVLRATSVADPTAISNVYVRVLPAGPIRIAAGIQWGTITDGLGNVWLPNLFFRSGDTVYKNGDTAAWPIPGNATQAAQLAVYRTYAYNYGNDQVGHFNVPNGTYNVRLMFAQPYNGSSSSNCSPFPTKWHDYIGVEIQNKIVVTNYDFGAANNHACAAPVDLNLPATVTGGTLDVSLRNTAPDGAANTSVMFSGVEITRIK